MASTKEYLDFILEQLSELEEITYRAMMGEYIIYYRGKVVGGIYDDRFLVKPVKSAIDATMDVALSAAFNDPRFPEVKEDEFESLEFEVTVLTKPELITVAHYEQYFDEIEIGRDGLIIQKGFAKGLLLPQVATENLFTKEEFLEHTCMKAGISADSWMDESCDVFKFQGQIFK